MIKAPKPRLGQATATLSRERFQQRFEAGFVDPAYDERWSAAHGIIILTPVHWYYTTSPLKLMIDRYVPMGATRIPPAPQARTRRRPRRSSWQDGTTPNISPGASMGWSSMAT
jgi:multimeric flavodoxin WrbA